MKKFYFSLVALMCTLMASAVDITGGTKFYLSPGVWNTDDAWFSMYVYGSAGNGWATFADADGDGVYEAEAPEGTWSNLIMVRNDPKYTTPSWDSGWNQSEDLTYDGTNNLYTISGWDNGADNKSGGSWSTYTLPEPPAVELNVTSNTNIYQTGATEWVWYQLWVYGLTGVETTDVTATIEAKDSEGNVVETKTIAALGVDGDGNVYSPFDFTTLAQGTTYTFVGTVIITLADGSVVTAEVAEKEFTTLAADHNELKATLEYTVAATETEATLSYKVIVTGNTAEPTSYKVWLDALGNVEMASGTTAEGELKVDLTGGAVTYWLKGQVVVDEQTINTDPNDVSITFTPKTPAPEVENANIAAGEEGWSQLGVPSNEAEAWAPAAYHETTIDENGILSFSITLPSVPAVGFVAEAYVSSVEGEQGADSYGLALAAAPAEVTNGIVTYTGTSSKAYTELPVYVTYRFAYAGGESKVKQIAVSESSEEGGEGNEGEGNEGEEGGETPAPEVENANIAAGEEGWSQLGVPSNEAEAWAPAAYHETTIDENGILSFSITLPSVPAVGFVAEAYVSSVEGEQGADSYGLALAAAPAEVTNGIVTYTGTSSKAYTELPVYVTYRFAYAGGESKVKQIAVGESSEEEPVEPVEEYYVFLNNTANWTQPYVWAWNSAENCTATGTWPGDAMTDMGDGLWKWVAPEGKLPENIIFSNGEGVQTVNLTYKNGKTYDCDGNVEGEEKQIPDPALIGSLWEWNAQPFTETAENEWTITFNPAITFTTDHVIKVCGYIGGADWNGGINCGSNGNAITLGQPYELVNDANSSNISPAEEFTFNKAVLNFSKEDLTKITLTLLYDTDVVAIDGIEADDAAEVEYYNLQGLKVENPENGLFIRKQGNKVSKVLVK